MKVPANHFTIALWKISMVGLCLLGFVADIFGWDRLKNWCIKQTEPAVDPRPLQLNASTHYEWLVDALAIAFLFAAAIFFLITL